MVFGGASLAVLFALVTNELVSLRLARTLGVVPGGLSDHAVVTGVGSIGYRIIEELVEAGISVAAVERAETSRFVAAARALGVPVVVGDASLTQTLSAVRLERARCLFAVTDDDVANLQTALNARSLVPEVPTVVRLFDADLAKRVERDLRLPSRSVSELAAPAFAAAALN